MTASNALKVIMESERSRKQHERARRWFKPRSPALRHLRVPGPVVGATNNIYDLDSYRQIDDPKDIFDVLLRRNYRHLRQSDNSVFSQPPVLDHCGWFAEHEGVQQLLDGLLDTVQLGSQYPHFPREATAFLQALGQSARPDGRPTEPFRWTYGVEEYTATFRKTRESTACGPSGLHMSHWKAACKRERIARVHAFFICAAFQFGFSYERWERSWHCMIPKTKVAIYPKLRIIQLFEGDFNAALKYLLGRVLMKYMTEEGLHDKEVFGSRVGKTAPEAILNLQLAYDNHRIWNKIILTLFNDAEGCYDRIVPSLCEASMRRTGCPASIAHCHTLVQKKMVHQIRMAAGVSAGCIAFAQMHSTLYDKDGHIARLEGPTGGIGQGGGGGPIAWISVILVMILAYRNLCPGVMMEDTLGRFIIMLHVISYVDDNTLARSFPSNTTTTAAFDSMADNLDTWNKLLQVTGGNLCLEKCEVSAMLWKYDRMGVPSLVGKTDNPITVEVASSLDTQHKPVQLKRLEPWEASRVLGLRIPMTGSMQIEFEHRLQQSKKLAKLIYQAPLSPIDSYVVYRDRWRSAMGFPLTVTQFTEKQCDEIQKPFIFCLLPQISFNRHIKRDIVYGPMYYGGCELFDLRIEQPATHWHTTLGHLRRMDTVGQGLQLTLLDHQVYIGSASFFLHLSPERYHYAPTNTRWTYTWNILHKYSFVIEMPVMWRPTPRSRYDVNIMDMVTSHPYYQHKEGRREIWHINRVRLYLKAFYLSDLTTDGIHIC